MFRHQCSAAVLENTLVCMRWMPINTSLVAFSSSTPKHSLTASRLEFCKRRPPDKPYPF